MSVNIQQADKTLKKVADTTVVNKSTITAALGYTPVKIKELNEVKTELNSSITILNTNTTTSVNNLQQQINALGGSSFDGDYNKLKNAPILNDADGTATFADETGNIIARIDNNGFETTNLNLHGDIELADKKLEIIDETGNIVLRIDNNGVETKTTNELKTQVANINTELPTKAPINNPTFTGVPKAPSPIDNSSQRIATADYVDNAVAGLQENIGDVFDFNDDGTLTLADTEGRKIAEFDNTGLRVTNVTIGEESKPIDVAEKLSNIDTALNDKMDKVPTAVGNNLASFAVGGQVKDSGVAIATTVVNNDTSMPTGKAVKTFIENKGYMTDADASAKYITQATAAEQHTAINNSITVINNKIDNHIAETDGKNKLHITTAERAAWDAAKDYNNLTNKPIEQDGNDKEFIITYNDENHIMARINDTGLRVLDVEIGPEGSSTTLSEKIKNIDTELSNRYTETETDQKIAEAIANADHLKRKIVDALPTTNIDERVIYMLKAASNEISDKDSYDEYMYINNVWERLGSWQTDLSDYAKTDNVNTQFNALNFYKTVKVGSASIEAKGNDDTLTFAAGSNVMLGVDTENNTITIGSVDTNLNGVDMLGTGNAITSGSYNTKTKKVVLTKGETFATKTEHDNHVTEYTDFKTDFDEKFDFKTNENSLDITDGNNIIATFDANGLRTTTVILGNTNSEVLIDLMNIDYDSLFAFNVNEIVGGETSPVELASNELLLTNLDGDYVVVEKGE